MRIKVDLNCDMGESFGAYRIGNDEEVITYITSSNIACGFHASDPRVMRKTVDLCKKHGVSAGAHPGYPDILGFGRRFMDVPEGELVDYMVYQIGALHGFLASVDLPLQHVKMHGALYNYLIAKEELFLKIVEAVRKGFGNVIFLTLGAGKSTELKSKCRDEGMRIALEAFPDRQYTDEGRLVPRTNARAVLSDPMLIAERAVAMVKKKGIESIGGQWIAMDIDTICIHGDNRESIAAAGEFRRLASREDIEIAPLHTFI